MGVAAPGAVEDSPGEDAYVPHGRAVTGLVEHPLDPGPFQQGQSKPADWLPPGRVQANREVAAAGDDVPAVLVFR